MTRTTSADHPARAPRPGPAARLRRWLALCGVLLVFAVLAISVIPNAMADAGDSAASAVPIGADGALVGTVAPNKSLWYRFSYTGGNVQSTVAITFVPVDASKVDLQLFTGDPSNPRQENTSATSTNNTRTIQFTDPSTRDVFVKVLNNNSDRPISFTGTVTPTSSLATPTPSPTSTGTPLTANATPNPGDNATTAVTVGGDGQYSGTIGARRAVWYRFWYGNPGANANVAVSVSPSADNADLNLYTGPDPNSITQQGGSANKTSTALSRSVNLPSQQFVYFTIANNNDASTLAYSGTVTPAYAPPATPTAVVTGTPAATGTPAVTSTPTATPTASPQPAPPVAKDSQYYSQTGFRVDDQALQFFQSRGAVKTFGYPVSRLFTFLGCPVQMYQRLIIQLCGGQGPAVINMLDPEIFPYTSVNGSVFPSPDSNLKNSTPRVGTPEYAGIMSFVQANSPDTFNGQNVNFWQTYQALGGLEILGTPISPPQVDPNNHDFVYQRFQRVILHYRAAVGTTEPLLLADYLKAVIANNSYLPGDLKRQAQNSKFYAQYCPGGTRWICRPNDLPGSDLTFAFEATQ